MGNLGAWLKAQLGPSPVVSLSMLVMTTLGVLSAFQITPSIPPWLGYAVLIVIVTAATVYWVSRVMRLWPQAVRDVRSGRYRMKTRAEVLGNVSNGAEPRIEALDELKGMTRLEFVKAEIDTLIQRLRVETARREQGLPTAPDLAAHGVRRSARRRQDGGCAAVWIDPARSRCAGKRPSDRDRPVPGSSPAMSDRPR